jgi:hypothetical protein
MHLAVRNANEIADLGDMRPCPDAELEDAVENIERFVIGGVPIGRRACPGSHERLDEAVASLRLTDEKANEATGDEISIGLRAGHE